MDASVRFGTQIIGALPVIVHYFERLGLGAIIDEVVPWEGGVPLGTLVEIMIANRLLNPQALYRIGEWAHHAGLTDYYGVTAEQLNDDLLGRALERLAKYADVIEAALVTRAIKVFKLQVNQIHFDITDVELYGAYEQPLSEGQTAPTPRPAYGRTKSGRTIRVKYRLIFVWSEAKARQEGQTRERHVSKIREEFEAIERNLNKYSLTTQEKILGRLESAKAKYSQGGLFEYKLTKDGKGRFHLTWKISAQKLARLQQLEGVYVLKTNLPSRRCPTAKALSTYKEQSQVERRFHHCKGPLAVAPMFPEKPERMAGLLCILVWALMVMALMERQTRRSLKGKPLYGLYPENRPSPAPTGPAILKCFSTLCIVIVKEHGKVSRRLGEAAPIQRKLLHLLDIPPDELQTFKRRCGT